MTGQSGPVNLASKMAPKSKRTPPEEKETEKVEKRKKKVVKDVRADIVPNCPPERSLFLEALGLESTQSTNLTGSHTPSPQPQRNQPARAARSAPGVSQPRESTQAILLPDGRRAKSKSTRGSARKATTGKAKENPSPEPKRQRSSLQTRRASRSSPGTQPKNKAPELNSDGKSTNNREKQRRKWGAKRKRVICSKNGVTRLTTVTPRQISMSGRKNGKETYECCLSGAKGFSPRRIPPHESRWARTRKSESQS